MNRKVKHALVGGLILTFAWQAGANSADAGWRHRHRAAGSWGGSYGGSSGYWAAGWNGSYGSSGGYAYRHHRKHLRRAYRGWGSSGGYAGWGSSGGYVAYANYGSSGGGYTVGYQVPLRAEWSAEAAYPADTEDAYGEWSGAVYERNDQPYTDSNEEGYDSDDAVVDLRSNRRTSLRQTVGANERYDARGDTDQASTLREPYDAEDELAATDEDERAAAEAVRPASRTAIEPRKKSQRPAPRELSEEATTALEGTSSAALSDAADASTSGTEPGRELLSVQPVSARNETIIAEPASSSGPLLINPGASETESAGEPDSEKHVAVEF